MTGLWLKNATKEKIDEEASKHKAEKNKEKIDKLFPEKSEKQKKDRKSVLQRALQAEQRLADCCSEFEQARKDEQRSVDLRNKYKLITRKLEILFAKQQEMKRELDTLSTVQADITIVKEAITAVNTAWQQVKKVLRKKRNMNLIRHAKGLK